MSNRERKHKVPTHELSRNINISVSCKLKARYYGE